MGVVPTVKKKKKDITQKQFIWVLFLVWAIVVLAVVIIVLAPIMSS